MAKILITMGARNWSTEKVCQGILPYIDHDVELTNFWIGGYDSADWDIIYIHSGAVTRGEYKEYIRTHRDDCKWIIGIRGPTAFKRNYKRMEIYDGYSAGCEWFKDLMMEYTDKPGFVCHGGIDTSLFTPQPFPEEFTIGWAGKPASGAKRFGRFAGLPFNKHIAAASSLNLIKERFAVTGQRYKYQDMPQFYKKISLYVNTSYREGGPLPPKEAAACGKPVIATGTGDTMEWLPKEYIFDSGKYTPDFDRDGMINMIERFKSDENFLIEEGKKMRERVLRFDHKIVAKEYENMFNRILE